MFWNYIWGFVVIVLLASGMFGVVTWIVNAWLIGAVVVMWAVSMYNGLVSLRMRVHEALSDIDVQLKRRFDLIPNLMESVKGYMSHEKGVLEHVTEARAKVARGGTPIERAGAEAALSGAMTTLFAVAENYPDLKANQNFLSLQNDLTDTENKIQAARRFYNSTVMGMNATVASFPSNILAGAFGFTKEKFFEVSSAAEREVVKVSF